MISSAPHLFLALSESAQPPGPVRALNAAGRWAVVGTAQSPLLAWHPSTAAAANAAAQRAAQAHAGAVVVVPREAVDEGDVGPTTLFTDAFEAALQGPTPHSAAKRRRLRTEADKLEAFCMVVRAASAAMDQPAFAAVGRAASTALKAKFGGGSITSAFAWLAGAAGREALENVRMGEVELEGALSIAEVIDAVKLAREAEQLRAPG